jgi:hypothetical protein
MISLGRDLLCDLPKRLLGRRADIGLKCRLAQQVAGTLRSSTTRR